MKRSTVLILIIITIALNVFMTQKCDFNREKVPGQLLNRKENSENFDNAELRREINEKLNLSRQNSITSAVEKIEPAVVSINVIKTEVVRRTTDPFSNPFFGFFDIPYKRNVQSIGSGVIFTEDGYIITNSHVVKGATKIVVILADSRQFGAKLIGIDDLHDVAIIKINKGKNLPVAKLGSSEHLIIGEWAIAVGNPYAFLIKDSKPSVSVGVISATDRNFAENQNGKIYKKMIQTDAAINPGNSGGPLVNILGEVIGINTFIFSESGGSVGIGFSIPINRVVKIAKELIKYGKIRQVWLGFKVQDLSPMIAGYLNLNSLDGVIVNYLANRGPAQKSGLKRGDVITHINGLAVKNADEAEIAVSDISVGEKINVTVKRGSKSKTIEIIADEY
ncbi:MAG: hypothetical protein CSB55_00595 [Candidatus Cloacimonadota bacterium]|nr:MAG: hypothetical protein CSB55_00595 [Candidatus Cloacimonadota bacterium]